jgi:hypothetical protein
MDLSLLLVCSGIFWMWIIFSCKCIQNLWRKHFSYNFFDRKQRFIDHTTSIQSVPPKSSGTELKTPFERKRSLYDPPSFSLPRVLFSTNCSSCFVFSNQMILYASFVYEWVYFHLPKSSTLGGGRSTLLLIQNVE